MRDAQVRLSGMCAAALGTLAVLALMVAMNRQFTRPATTADDAGSAIELVRKEPPKPRDVVPRREPPKRRPTRPDPAPPLGLDAGLAGLDFGLPTDDGVDMDLGDSLLGDGGDVIMTDDTVDQPPRPVLQAPMRYPPRAKAQGVTGYVVLNLLIGPTGQVERVAVLEAQPAGVFDEVAMEAVQRWKFEPASYRGEHVRVWARQKVRFDLAGA